MTVSVLEGQDVVALRQRVEVGVVLEESYGQVAIERLSTTLIGEEKVLG
jgi:hypothetical protein